MGSNGGFTPRAKQVGTCFWEQEEDKNEIQHTILSMHEQHQQGEAATKKYSLTFAKTTKLFLRLCAWSFCLSFFLFNSSEN
jgi:hypothetical protein